MTGSPKKGVTRSAVPTELDSSKKPKQTIEIDDSDSELDFSRIIDQEEVIDLIKQILTLDPNMTICIHNYIEYYQSDCLILERISKRRLNNYPRQSHLVHQVIRRT